MRSSLHRHYYIQYHDSIYPLELTSDEYNVQDAKEALGGSTWFGGNHSVRQYKNIQLRCAVRCKTVQCLNAFTNDTQDVQKL